MSLERLTRNALEARKLDGTTREKIQRHLERRPHLAAEEYEALRSLGRALRSGEVAQEREEAPVR